MPSKISLHQCRRPFVFNITHFPFTYFIKEILRSVRNINQLLLHFCATAHTEPSRCLHRASRRDSEIHLKWSAPTFPAHFFQRQLKALRVPPCSALQCRSEKRNFKHAQPMQIQPLTIKKVISSSKTPDFHDHFKDHVWVQPNHLGDFRTHLHKKMSVFARQFASCCTRSRGAKITTSIFHRVLWNRQLHILFVNSHPSS